MEAGRLVRGREEAGGPQATGAQEPLGDESRGWMGALAKGLRLNVHTLFIHLS